MTIEAQDALLISSMLVSFIHIGGHCIYNSPFFINFPILDAEFTTKSWKHEIISKLLSA